MPFSPEEKLEINAKQPIMTPKPPIVFKSPSLTPDVSFTVFNQKFHVSSLTLQLESEIFRGLLNLAANLRKPNIGNPNITREWYTKLADFKDVGYLSWGFDLNTRVSYHKILTYGKVERLTCLQCKNNDYKLFVGNTDHEEKVFAKFLSAIFNKPYRLDTVAELSTLAKLARQYLVVPLVSNSLDSAFVRNPNFLFAIMKDPLPVLAAAIAFQNELLYRDTLMLLLGPWSSPAYLRINNQEMRKQAKDAHAVISAKVEKAQREIFVAIAEQMGGNSAPSSSRSSDRGRNSCANLNSRTQETRSDVGKQITDTIPFCVRMEVKEGSSPIPHMMMPTFYRKCFELPITPATTRQKICDAIAPILRNHLTVGNFTSGVDPLRDHFLCLQLEDIQLPWEKTEGDRVF